MSEIKNGGPAFPVECDWIEGQPQGRQTGPQVGWHEGMTLRDYFAAQAMSGVCHMIATGMHELGLIRPNGAAGIAHTAYELADAMLRARGAA
jgi:hypothetical protein